MTLATWPPAPVSPAPAREPIATVMRATQSPAAYSPYEGFKSFADEGALTIDDIVKGLSKMPASYRPFAEAPVAPAVAPKTEPIYEHVEPIYENVEPIRAEAPAPMSAPVAPIARPAAVTTAPPAQVPAFLDALLRGDREATFGMLREVVRNGSDAEAFFTQVACALDDAYRARLEGISVHPEIARITAPLATPVLERVVTAFASAVDSSYSVGITGAKLALTRALATLGA